MNHKKIWCSACHAFVDVVVDHAATALLTSLGLGVGAGLGGKKAKEGALLGAAMGLGVGLLASQAKRLLCPCCSADLA